MKRRKLFCNKYTRILYTWIAVLAAVSFVLWIPAYAESAGSNTTVFGEGRASDTYDTDCEKTGQGEADPDPAQDTELQLLIEDYGQKNPDAVTVSGLRITGEEEAKAPLQDHRKKEEIGRTPSSPETVTVVCAEGSRWEIPLFWTDDSNTLVEKGETCRNGRPVLAFFVPEEYAVQKDAENGFTVTLDAWLSGLYKAAGGAVCFYEPRTQITYILAAGADLSFLEKQADKLPAEPIPGLPEGLQKPTDGTYRNPSPKPKPVISLPEGETETGRREDESDRDGGTSQEEELPQADSRDGAEEAQEQKEVPLSREQLLAHCAGNTLDKYGEDEMADLVDLIINCIQPQAVTFIKDKFPAFAGAAREGALGKEIGLYVYRMYGEEDGVKAHADTSVKALAYVNYQIDKDEEGKTQLGYVIGVNTFYFQTRDEDGTLHIDTSEQAAANLDNSIIHEMFHAFMCDYNRTGMIGTREPEDYLKAGKKLQEVRDVYGFPEWFKEGIASAVENVYQYRYEYFQLLRYEGEGRIGDRHTAENLLNTYLTRNFLLEDDIEYEDNYDIGAGAETSTSAYVTGYLADLYLGELAAKHEKASSVSPDGKGNKRVSSEAIRLGLDSILARLHKGETLDEIICSISGGSYQDVRDFEQKFIKGTDQKGDQASIGFCVDFLNYMQDIGAESTYIPNGSILFDFDRDYTSPIDRSVNVKTDLYRITDSSDYTVSTVSSEVPYTDGGKSRLEKRDAAAEAAGGTDAAEDTTAEGSTAEDTTAEDTAAEPSFDRESADPENEVLSPESEPADPAEEVLSPESEPADPAKEDLPPESGSGDCRKVKAPAEDEAADFSLEEAAESTGSGSVSPDEADSAADTAAGPEEESGDSEGGNAEE